MAKKAILRIFIFYIAFIGLFLFLPAGSFRYWEGWVYSFALSVPMVITVSYLMLKDPALLERRMRFKEKEEKQKMIVKLFRLPFLLGFLIPGFDHRFGWSEVPVVLVVISNIMVFLGYFWVFLVFRENSYTSRIVEVEKDQKVISTGPYAWIRHPMYTGTILMFLFTPMALGSWWALIVFGFLPPILIVRLLNEEKVLHKELQGYGEYCQKTRYRLIPYVW
jgi:protein-S-isoprenylcysteine O-methyltransferase Ste14